MKKSKEFDIIPQPIVSSLIACVVTIAGNYWLQVEAWDANNILPAAIILSVISLITIFAIFNTIKWYKSVLPLPAKQVPIPALGESLNPKRKQKLKARIKQQRIKRRNNLYQVIENNRGHIFLTLIALIILVFMNVSIFNSFITVFTIRTAMKDSRNRIESGVYNNLYSDSNIYHIVIENIKGTGVLSQKFDLTRTIRDDLDDKRKKYNLPVQIDVKDYSLNEINYVTEDDNGILVVSGWYDEHEARLKIEDKSILNDTLNVAKSLGIFAPEIYDYLIKRSKSRKNIPWVDVIRDLRKKEEQEYVIKIGVPKEVQYFTYKMIGELIIKKIMLTGRRAKNEIDRENLCKAIDFAIDCLNISASNIPHDLNFFGFSASPKSGLNTGALLFNLSSLYALKANMILSTTEMEALKPEELIRAQLELQKAARCLEQSLTTSLDANFYRLSFLYRITVEMNLADMQMLNHMRKLGELAETWLRFQTDYGIVEGARKAPINELIETLSRMKSTQTVIETKQKEWRDLLESIHIKSLPLETSISSIMNIAEELSVGFRISIKRRELSQKAELTFKSLQESNQSNLAQTQHLLEQKLKSPLLDFASTKSIKEIVQD